MQELQKVFYFDMDGVLSDFGAVAKSMFGIDSDAFKNIPRKDMTTEMKESQQEMFRLIDLNIRDFTLNAPVITGAKELFNIAADNFDQVRILTAYSPNKISFSKKYDAGWIDKVRMMMMYKREWIQRNISKIPDSDIIMSFVPKWHFIKPGQVSYLLDDMRYQIDGWRRHGGHGILYEGFTDAISRIKNAADLPVVRMSAEIGRITEGERV
jgi:hypothetical protein